MHVSVNDALRQVTASYKWHHIQRLPTDRGLPYAYVLRKFKDVRKPRPIVSYARHPAKRLLNLCGRAIAFLLSTADVRHCVLWRTHDLVQRLQDIVRSFRSF